MAELLAAVVVWGAIGFGLDHLLHTGPWLLATGLLIGHGAGIYIAIWRGEQMRKAAQMGGGK
jgi:F0F1-type ATP synthase assembly protein I